MESVVSTVRMGNHTVRRSTYPLLRRSNCLRALLAAGPEAVGAGQLAVGAGQLAVGAAAPVAVATVAAGAEVVAQRQIWSFSRSAILRLWGSSESLSLLLTPSRIRAAMRDSPRR